MKNLVIAAAIPLCVLYIIGLFADVRFAQNFLLIVFGVCFSILLSAKYGCKTR